MEDLHRPLRRAVTHPSLHARVPGDPALLASRLLVVVLVAATMAAVPTGASASLDDDGLHAGMGFLTGGRRYVRTPFHLSGGEVSGAAGLAAPFYVAPFDSVEVYGVRHQVRLVLSGVRMTAAYDQPFPSFDVQRSEADYTVGDDTRRVIVRSLGASELRAALGYEHAFGDLVPFVDLAGSAHWIRADLALDGQPVTYRANDFAFTLSGGVRYQVRRTFFVTAEGEVGLVGPVIWNASLGVGFRTR